MRRLMVFFLAAFPLAFAPPSRASDESPWFKSPRVHDVVLLSIAETLIVIDVLQTTDMNRHPDRGYHEINPLLGPHPSTGRILAGGALAAGSTALLWYVLPNGVRTVFATTVIGFEVPCVLFNAQAGLSVRFPF